MVFSCIDAAQSTVNTGFDSSEPMAQPAGGRPPGIEDLRVESFKLRVDAHVKRAVLLKRESSGGIGPGTSPLPDYDRVPVRVAS